MGSAILVSIRKTLLNVMGGGGLTVLPFICARPIRRAGGGGGALGFWPKTKSRGGGGRGGSMIAYRGARNIVQ